MEPPVTAIVPLKSLADAKQRLAPSLPPGARRALAAWMFERVATACRSASAVVRVVAVVGDEEGASLAAAQGLDVIREPRRGLGRALATADSALGDAPVSLVVAADLPLVEAADVDAVCRAADRDAVVVVAPTVDGGTGALLRRPPDVIRPAYGPGSAARHLALAQAAGVGARTVRRRGLALDVDDAAGLSRARAEAPGLVPAELA